MLDLLGDEVAPLPPASTASAPDRPHVAAAGPPATTAFPLISFDEQPNDQSVAQAFDPIGRTHLSESPAGASDDTSCEPAPTGSVTDPPGDISEHAATILSPAATVAPIIALDELPAPVEASSPAKPSQLDQVASDSNPASPRTASDGAAAASRARQDGDGMDGGGDSLQVNSDSEPASAKSEDGSDRSAGSFREDSDSGGPGSGVADSDPPASDEAGGDERLVDSDREVVEEEDAFGDFADFTSASHFMPSSGLGFLHGASGSASSQQPPPSASAAAAAAAAVRAGGAGASSSGSPSSHRHAHYSGGYPPRAAYGSFSSGVGGGGQPHAGPASTASEPGSCGDFSDFHASPPPSIAPSRAGGGRKSVASLASVGSRAGGDDDVGDYGSIVGSSVWRAPSQMATSSYAAAAGADDDFGDFTSDITSQSDFAPSTQPPSAVAVSGPGSAHPDDDFGSFASHRSNADDDDDDFGNFAAAPAAAGVGPAPQAGGSAGSVAAAGPSNSGGAAAAPAAPASAAAPGTGVPGAAAATGPSSGAAAGPAGGTSPLLSPRDAAATPAAPATAAGTSHPFHSTQTVVPAGAGGSAAEAAAAEPALLQLPSEELRNAVTRALQPLLQPGSPLASPPLASGQVLPEDQVAAAWAQLRRHMQGAMVDGAIAAYNGVPLPPLPGSAEATNALAASGAADGAAGRGSYMPPIKFSRPLRWKGSDSERRLLASLGLSELAAQARAAEAAEGPRPGARSRSDRPGGRPLGRLASFGDAPRRACAEAVGAPGCIHDASAVGGCSGGGAVGSRARGMAADAGSAGSLLELGAGGSGSTPKTAGATNGHALAQG